jgi:hypothetical protein
MPPPTTPLSAPNIRIEMRIYIKLDIKEIRYYGVE